MINRVPEVTSPRVRTDDLGILRILLGAMCVLFACGACARHKGLSPGGPGTVRPLPPTQTRDPNVFPAPSYVTGPEAREAPFGASWGGEEVRSRISADHRNFYSRDTGRKLLLGIGVASVLANTSLDQDFRDCYQNDIRGESTTGIASACKPLGDGRILIPSFFTLWLLREKYEHLPCGGPVGELASRTARGYLVGGPPILLMQWGTGGSRPGEAEHGSHWRPFSDANGASGHAFVGAVPFLAAAEMTDSPWLKGGLYLCSTLPTWSRLDHDAHYLSQCCLGWWTAYLACRAVDETEQELAGFTLMPVAASNMVGLAFVHER